MILSTCVLTRADLLQLHVCVHKYIWIFNIIILHLLPDIWTVLIPSQQPTSFRRQEIDIPEMRNQMLLESTRHPCLNEKQLPTTLSCRPETRLKAPHTSSLQCFSSSKNVRIYHKLGFGRPPQLQFQGVTSLVCHRQDVQPGAPQQS